jgi:hypothetical protein
MEKTFIRGNPKVAAGAGINDNLDGGGGGAKGTDGRERDAIVTGAIELRPVGRVENVVK